MVLDPNYKIITTEDGSPSLVHLKSEELSEPMHNLKGAFSESLFIYGENILKIFEHKLPPRFLSVGLGLGYNELIVCCYSLIFNKTPYIESYESEDFLRNGFQMWANGKISIQNLTKTYEKILNSCARHFQLDPLKIKHQLQNLINQNQLIINSALTAKQKFTSPFSSILFDAFSEKMSPSLWNEEFLNSFLKNSSSQDKCIFSSYAAKGTLNRALKNNHFTKHKKEGFMGKRQSTWATKGLEG